MTSLTFSRLCCGVQPAGEAAAASASAVAECATARDCDDDADDSDGEEGYYGPDWGMFSAAGEAAVGAVIQRSRTWAQFGAGMERLMQREEFGEAGDTECRERIFEGFERKLRRAAANGIPPFVSMYDAVLAANPGVI